MLLYPPLLLAAVLSCPSTGLRDRPSNNRLTGRSVTGTLVCTHTVLASTTSHHFQDHIGILHGYPMATVQTCCQSRTESSVCHLRWSYDTPYPGRLCNY